jgi:hypothetical protein
MAVYAQQNSYRKHVEQLLETHIKTWLHDPAVLDSIKAQNRKHAALTQEDIDRMDKQWRSEVKASARPLIDTVLAHPLSVFLRQIKAQNNGLFSEIFIMDNKGLNVGQSDVTSDYWQGDEAKWQKTYAVGPHALVIGDREYDESSRKFLIQVSVPVVDPATKTPIGAATIGVSLVQLIRLGAVAGNTR